MSYYDIPMVKMKPAEFFEYRKQIDVRNIEIAPDALNAILDDNNLYLEVGKQNTERFQIKDIFVRKLFRWFHTNTEIVPFLSNEAKLKIINDLLGTIYYRGKKYIENDVKLRVESGAVYSILAKNYETVEDEQFYEAIKPFGITYIEHSPYITRFISDVRLKTEAIVGDIMGYALHFTNSQTGFGALSSSVFVYRYTCKNGAVAMSGNRNLIYHGKDALSNFNHSISDLEHLFDDLVSDFDKGLVKARTIKYEKKLHPMVRNLIAPALSVYETKDMMGKLEGCKNIWEVYDHVTTSAKTPDLYKNFLLQEAAGNIITRLVKKTEEEDDPDQLF